MCLKRRISKKTASQIQKIKRLKVFAHEPRVEKYTASRLHLLRVKHTFPRLQYSMLLGNYSCRLNKYVCATTDNLTKTLKWSEVNCGYKSIKD